MNTPYLVQRGTFRKTDKFEGLDSLVAYDYMGSAEFEFGTLGKALKEIVAVLPKLILSETNIKTENGRELWLLCQPEDEKALHEFWDKAVNDRFSVRTKELLWYGAALSKDKIGSDDTEFWWDVGEKQCWMAALGQTKIKNVLDALKMVKKKKGW